MEEVLFHGVIQDPPTKYVSKIKKPKPDKDGKIKTENVYYLTANLFYDGTHWSIKNKIVNFAKDWVIWFLKTIPKIEKCQIEITYHYPTDGFDLDNKLYFWTKIILDLFKTPSSKQMLLAQKYKNDIKTLRLLDDDTVRFVDKITMEYKKGAPALEIKVIGRKASVQNTLF